LEWAIEKYQPKLLYIIPNFHNPAGIIYSEEKRRKILEILDGKNIVLLEDDAYNELYFNEEAKKLTRPVMAMNDKNIEMVYTGSFSKILGPGFRLGWMLASTEIYEKAEIIKQGIDACSPNFTQVLANEFLQRGLMDKYLERIRNAYAERSLLMKKSLEKYMPEEVKWNNPQGGFYYWLELPKNLDSTQILKKAVNNGAVFVTGKTFDPENKRNNFIRLSYSNMDIDQIDTGVEIIAKAIKNELKHQLNYL